MPPQLGAATLTHVARRNRCASALATPSRPVSAGARTVHAGVCLVSAASDPGSPARVHWSSDSRPHRYRCSPGGWGIRDDRWSRSRTRVLSDNSRGHRVLLHSLRRNGRGLLGARLGACHLCALRWGRGLGIPARPPARDRRSCRPCRDGLLPRWDRGESRGPGLVAGLVRRLRRDRAGVPRGPDLARPGRDAFSGHLGRTRRENLCSPRARVRTRSE